MLTITSTHPFMKDITLTIDTEKNERSWNNKKFDPEDKDSLVEDFNNVHLLTGVSDIEMAKEVYDILYDTPIPERYQFVYLQTCIAGSRRNCIGYEKLNGKTYNDILSKVFKDQAKYSKKLERNWYGHLEDLQFEVYGLDLPEQYGKHTCKETLPKEIYQFCCHDAILEADEIKDKIIVCVGFWR